MKARILATLLGNRRWHGSGKAVCSQIVVGGLKCYHPSMKRIRSSSTELWHILAVYIVPCDLVLWPIYSIIGSCDQDSMLMIYAYFEVSTLRFWDIRSENQDFVVPLLGNQCCHSNYCLHLLLERSSWCHLLSMKFIGPHTTELLQFLSEYVTWRCDLDFFTLESCHVMPLGWSIPVPSLN